MSKKETTISASKIKTFKSCSFKFFSNYILRIPEKTNMGALMGSCCHVVFEHLLKPRHLKKYEAIKNGEPDSCATINLYVRKYVKQNKMPADCYEKILAMIKVGLDTDYFCVGGEMQEPEMSFDISNDNPRYRIKGFLDKVSIYNDKFVRILDYKSVKSSEDFEGDNLKDNVQAKMYSLALKKKWPHLIPIVEFLLLQFPEKPLRRVSFSQKELVDFEKELEEVYEKIDSFTEKDASSNFAAEKYPEGKGFNGKLQCGWNYRQGHIQSPDETKKDGSPKFRCPYRFPMDYLALVNDETGEIAQTCFLDETLKPRDGHSIIKKKYRGCKFFYPESY